MSQFSWTEECGSVELDRRLAPIDDIVLERREPETDAADRCGETANYAGETAPLSGETADYDEETAPPNRDSTHPSEKTAVFSAIEGPFEEYQRRLQATKLPDGGYRLHTLITYRLSIPFWSFLLSPLVRRRLRQRCLGGGQPWWAPSERIDPRSGRMLGVLCVLAVIDGYLGTLLSQSISFAADEFGVGVSVQGNVLSAVRLGALLALGFVILADRKGRRPLLLLCVGAACVATIGGAVSGEVWTFGTTQVLARGSATAAFLLMAVMSSEEVPKGVRGYAVSVMGMAAGLGSGIVIWLLPLADLGLRAWRILFLIPVAALPVVLWSYRRLPESRRFIDLRERAGLRERAAHRGLPPIDAGTPPEAPPAASTPPASPALAADATAVASAADRRRKRLMLLGATSMLSAVFAAPASQFLNEYLREERNFSAGNISVYQLVTYAPVGMGMLASGKLSDLRGRRTIGIVCLLASPVCITLRYLQSGWPMWLWGVLGGLAAGALVPVLGAYTSELFGTSLRARSNGQMTVVGVAGSVVGLQLVGNLTEPLGGFGQAFVLVAAAPLLVAVLIFLFFPETAREELEDINPEDASADGVALE